MRGRRFMLADIPLYRLDHIDNRSDSRMASLRAINPIFRLKRAVDRRV